MTGPVVGIDLGTGNNTIAMLPGHAMTAQSLTAEVLRSMRVDVGQRLAFLTTAAEGAKVATSRHETADPDPITTTARGAATSAATVLL